MEVLRNDNVKDPVMLKFTRGLLTLATSSAFAAMYAILGLIPVSPYLAGPGYLPLSKIVVPLVGILLGPLAGGLSITLGSFLDVAYTGQSRLPLGILPLDFAPDVAVALVAWLAYTGKWKEAIILPTALVFLFTIDPLSSALIPVGNILVPFVWMHLVSIAILVIGMTLQRRGRMNKDGTIFIAFVAFASLMAGQLAGTIIGQTLAVRIDGFFSADAWRSGRLVLIFYAYPVERIFYLIGSVILTKAVLRIVKPAKFGHGNRFVVSESSGPTRN